MIYYLFDETKGLRFKVSIIGLAGKYKCGRGFGPI